MRYSSFFFFFFFNDTATTEIYTLSLHDALPISIAVRREDIPADVIAREKEIYREQVAQEKKPDHVKRSEEHTSELQSLAYLVCRLLLEKKKKRKSSVRRLRARSNCRDTNYELYT